MKNQNVAIIALCIGIMLAVRLAIAGNDCPVNGSMPHSGEGCAHKTTSGDELCDTKQSGQDCDGTAATCSKLMFKRILSFPTEVDNGTDSKGCWTGHNYITTKDENCVETDTCTWEITNNNGGNCYQVNKNNGGGSWSKASYKTSNGCQ
jgi:hypothetical protein